MPLFNIDAGIEQLVVNLVYEFEAYCLSESSSPFMSLTWGAQLTVSTDSSLAMMGLAGLPAHPTNDYAGSYFVTRLIFAPNGSIAERNAAGMARLGLHPDRHVRTGDASTTMRILQHIAKCVDRGCCHPASDAGSARIPGDLAEIVARDELVGREKPRAGSAAKLTGRGPAKNCSPLRWARVGGDRQDCRNPRGVEIVAGKAQRQRMPCDPFCRSVPVEKVANLLAVLIGWRSPSLCRIMCRRRKRLPAALNRVERAAEAARRGAERARHPVPAGSRDRASDPTTASCLHYHAHRLLGRWHGFHLVRFQARQDLAGGSALSGS